jgi:hypothetical protein
MKYEHGGTKRFFSCTNWKKNLHVSTDYVSHVYIKSPSIENSCVNLLRVLKYTPKATNLYIGDVGVDNDALYDQHVSAGVSPLVSDFEKRVAYVEDNEGSIMKMFSAAPLRLRHLSNVWIRVHSVYVLEHELEYLNHCDNVQSLELDFAPNRKVNTQLYNTKNSYRVKMVKMHPIKMVLKNLANQADEGNHIIEIVSKYSRHTSELFLLGIPSTMESLSFLGESFPNVKALHVSTSVQLKWHSMVRGLNKLVHFDICGASYNGRAFTNVPFVDSNMFQMIGILFSSVPTLDKITITTSDFIVHFHVNMKNVEIISRSEWASVNKQMLKNLVDRFSDFIVTEKLVPNSKHPLALYL